MRLSLSRAYILRFNFMLLCTRWGPLFAQFISFCLRPRVSVCCHFDESFWIFNFWNVRLALAHGTCDVPYHFRRYHLRSPLLAHKMDKRTRVHTIKPNVTRRSRQSFVGDFVCVCVCLCRTICASGLLYFWNSLFSTFCLPLLFHSFHYLSFEMI